MWQRTLRAMSNLVHPRHSGILNGKFHTKPLYRARRDYGRPVTREVAVSISALADALEDEKPTPRGKGGEGGGRYEEIVLVAVPWMMRTDEPILANGAELERWGVYKKQLYSVLVLSTNGVANTFFVIFAGGPDPRQEPDGQAVWTAISEKYLNSSTQRRGIPMFNVNCMVMMLNQDPGEYISNVNTLLRCSSRGRSSRRSVRVSRRGRS